MQRALITLFFIGALFYIGGMPVAAQMLPGTEPLTLIVSPEHPRPYQVVSVAPRSSLFDLAASTVRISVNGTNVYEGSGTRPTTFVAGALGERSTIVVTVTDPSGQVYTVERTITPAEVSLIIESDSTTHPFYQGGALVGSEGRIRLIALADLRSAPGTRLSPQSLVYTWRMGDRILTDHSGIGRSSLVATAPIRYRNADITVTVTSPDSRLVGFARTTVSPVDPIARMYQNDPLLGPNFDTALSGRFTMQDTEATFRAVGYFFKVPPTFSWKAGGSNGGNDRDMTVRSTGAGQGDAIIQLTATEPDTRRSAESRFTLQFGTSNGFGFFGL